MTDEEIKEILEWVNGGITPEPPPYDPNFWKDMAKKEVHVSPPEDPILLADVGVFVV